MVDSVSVLYVDFVFVVDPISKLHLNLVGVVDSTSELHLDLDVVVDSATLHVDFVLDSISKPQLDLVGSISQLLPVLGAGPVSQLHPDRVVGPSHTFIWALFFSCLQ